jgi:hypothetical protein
MQEEADAQLKRIRENMSDLPERIRVWRNEPGNEVVISVPDQPYPTGSREYIRKDTVKAQIDAAVKAERERCAKVAEGRLGVSDALRKSSFWTKGMEEMVACAEEEARIIAAAIRKGEHP